VGPDRVLSDNWTTLADNLTAAGRNAAAGAGTAAGGAGGDDAEMTDVDEVDVDVEQLEGERARAAEALRARVLSRLLEELVVSPKAEVRMWRGGGELYTETHDTSEADARLCNGRPKPASALGLVGEADAKRNIHSIRPCFGRSLRRMLHR
jgi:hypothetical protein